MIDYLAMMLSLLFFASIWKVLCASNGAVEIERHNWSYTDEKWTAQPDTFKIPTGICSGNISDYCEAMGGHRVGRCKCKCNSERTTFEFWDNQWKCTANSKVRQYGGCSLILLDGRTEDSSTLMTVPLNLQCDIRYLMPTDHRRCYIIPYKSTYLLCNGSWIILDNNFINRRFIMVEGEDPQFFKFKNTTWDPDHEKFEGRILRITIGCYNKSNAIIPNCLLLKMQGTMKCPQFSLPSSTKLSTSTSPSTIPSTSETEIQTQKILPISTLKPTTMPMKVLSTAEPRPQTIPRTTTLKPTTLGSPSTIPHNKREKNAAEENDGGNTGLIVGVAVGVICLTLIIVAMVIIKRRRTKRNAAGAKSNKTVENVGYELGVDNSLKIQDHRPMDQDEYSYAYADAIPLGRRNISKNDQPDNQGPQTTVSNHMYGMVENLDLHGSPDQTSAAPDYAEVNKNPKSNPSCNIKGRNQSEEPFYNVLEESGSSNRPTGGSEPPCYHVLEGPFSEGAPYYSVLEKPPSNEPQEYRSLDGPNPSVYSVLNRDGSKRPFKQTPNYSDTVYDSVGDVINDTTDIYQKLDQNNQMIDVYQTLNNGHMLNQHDLTSHSNA